MPTRVLNRRGGCALLGSLVMLLAGGLAVRAGGAPAGAQERTLADAGDTRPADGGAPDGGPAGAGDARENHDIDAGGLGEAPTPLAAARPMMRTLAQGVTLIQRIAAKAPRDSFTADCVEEKLAEARIGLRIGDQEMARLETAIAGNDQKEQAYALRRLGMLVDRSTMLIKQARSCAYQDSGGVTTTKVEVEISPKIPRDDPTALPLPTPPADLRPPNEGR